MSCEQKQAHQPKTSEEAPDGSRVQPERSELLGSAGKEHEPVMRALLPEAEERCPQGCRKLNTVNAADCFSERFTVHGNSALNAGK